MVILIKIFIDYEFFNSSIVKELINTAFTRTMHNSKDAPVSIIPKNTLPEFIVSEPTNQNPYKKQRAYIMERMPVNHAANNL